jgi:hypothetical protein
MKNQIFNIAFIIIALLTANNTTSIADTSEMDMIFGASRTQAKATGAFGEVVNAAKNVFADEAQMANSPEFVRKPKMMTASYSGYRIELVTVFNKPLELTDDLFQQFGGIVIERRTHNSYTYLLGDFKTKEALEKYMNKIVKPRFTEAKGVKYKKGEQVKFK